MDGSLVLDLDLVGAGLDRLQVLAVELDLDRVAGADLAGQAGATGGGVAGRRRGKRDSDERERKQKAS